MTIIEPVIKKVDIRKLAHLIEVTLDSLGITARVVEVIRNDNDVDFNLEIALGTPLESITKHHRDLGMALASPTGDVEITAPIPGRSLVGIKVPFGRLKKPKVSGKTDKYKIIKIEVERIVYKGIFPQLKSFIVSLLKLIVNILVRLVNYLEK